MNNIFPAPSDSTTWHRHTGSPQEPVRVSAGTSASPSEETTVLTPLSLPFTSALLISQPCLPIYVSELKIAFSLAMAIQFGSGVFWVRACRAYRCISHSLVKRQQPSWTPHRVCALPLQAVLLVMSIKLMGQMKRKQEFMALLQSNRYVPGAF